MCEQLPRFKALSAGALILGGLFDRTLSPFHLTPTDEFRSRAAQIQHLLIESNRMGESGMGWGGRGGTFPAGMEWIDFVPTDLKVVLDICDVNATGSADHSSNRSTSVRIPLVFAVYLH